MAKLTEATEIFVPKYLKMQELLDKHERAHWGIWEVDVRRDIEQWRNGTLHEDVKSFIKMILRFFTQSDTNVCAGYVERLLQVYKNADVRMMLLSFATRETTHMKGYKLLNDSLGLDSEEFSREFLMYEEMRNKHEWMIEQVDMSTDQGRIEYVAKQGLMEGVSLFALFAMLLNNSRLGWVPGTVEVNQWSQADESLHLEGLVEIFKRDIEECPHVVNDEFKRNIYQFARDLIELEDKSIDLCFSVAKEIDLEETLKLTKADLKLYTRFVADYRMQQYGLKPQFGVTKNPIKWIDDVTGNVLGDFFDTTVFEYSKDNMVGEWVY